MNEKLFLLEMHWMEHNCGKLTFKSDNYNNPVKVNGMRDALGFVGQLVQISDALRLGAYTNGHIAISVAKPSIHWLLQYYFIQGIFNLVLLFKDIRLSNVYKARFVWSGAASDFIISVEHLRKNLQRFAFWGQIWPFKMRKW